MTDMDTPEVNTAFALAGITWDDLLAAATRAAANSFTPYSNFSVGAAVIDIDGTITTGANVESASYGLTCCAERVTLFAHLTAGHRHPVALAVVCPDGDQDQRRTLTPCGACRQIISEHLGDDGLVAIGGVGKFFVTDLLPLGFTLDPQR